MSKKYKPLPDEAIESLAEIAAQKISSDYIRRFCEVLPDIIFSVGDMAVEIKELRGRLGIEIPSDNEGAPHD